MKNRILIIFIASICFLSCTGNEIYFDITEKTIKSCNDKYLTKIYIKNIDSKEFYSIESIEIKSKYLDLRELDDNYSIINLKGEVLKNDKFVLKPLTSYEITNASWGDAVEQTIIVETNNLGQVITSNVLSCY
jgi:hypothetical protein